MYEVFMCKTCDVTSCTDSDVNGCSVDDRTDLKDAWGAGVDWESVEGPILIQSIVEELSVNLEQASCCLWDYL